MVRSRLILSLALVLLTAVVAAAQTGAGSLRGYVRDEQGGALPGVTVSARGEALIQPVSSVTDAEGYYRLINLPPGTFEVTADLTGFAALKRQELQGRPGTNIQGDTD